jgi:hypothetical protein
VLCSRDREPVFWRRGITNNDFFPDHQHHVLSLLLLRKD